MEVSEKKIVPAYTRPSLLFNSHLETIFPALFRKVLLTPYTRERITTSDGDFLDLDWITHSSKKLIVLSHGLEGNSERAYIKGMAKIFVQQGFDILAWNYRGCSEEMNKTLRFYHSGATEDLDCIIAHALQKGYEDIFLIGFSLGGNLTLKYLGEKGKLLPSPIKKAIAFSVPLNLYSSCLQISKSENWIYTYRFLRSLKYKVKRKAISHSNLSLSGLNQIRSLIEFDNAYTAPLHGFKNAIDYYEKCSALNFLNDIAIPTLIVNAKNDPFLSPDCFPTDFQNHPFLQLEYPHQGGHVGFSRFDKNGLYWSELRAHHFITS